MDNRTVFYLARHGQTEWNIEHRIQGQLNSPLTEKGRKEAKRLAKQCSEVGITRLLSSPLGRAMETAHICAEQLNLPVSTVAGFEERNFGLWQGKLITQVNIEPHYLETTTQITDVIPEQGESSKAMLLRFERALKSELKKALKERTLMIVHGDILRCFMDQFIDKTVKQIKVSNSFDYPNAQLITLSYDVKLDQFYYQ